MSVPSFGHPPVRLLLLFLGRRGGGARYAVETARALVASGEASVHLVVSSDGDLVEEFRALGVPCLGLETFRSGPQALLRLPAARRASHTVADYAAAHAVDAVHVPMWHVWDVPILRRLERAGIPALLTVHDARFHVGERLPLLQALLHEEIRTAAGLLTLTEHTGLQTQTIRGATRRRWVAPHAVPTHGGAVAGSARPHPGPRPFHLLLPGRMVEYKGIDVFLDALRSLHASRTAVQARLVGDGPALTNQVSALARHAGATVISRWLTEPELEQEIADADVVVLPYVDATQSGIIPLAQSFGVPVVTTAVGGLPEQVRHEVDGLVADAPTGASVAAAVRRLVEDEELYEACSRNAVAVAREELTWSRTADVVLAGVRSLVGSPEDGSHRRRALTRFLARSTRRSVS